MAFANNYSAFVLSEPISRSKIGHPNRQIDQEKYFRLTTPDFNFNLDCFFDSKIIFSLKIEKLW